MDISMPEMDGLTAVKKIRKLLKLSNINDSQQPYICCCTAYNEAAFKKKAIDTGMDHFMAKPITGEDITTLLNLLF